MLAVWTHHTQDHERPSIEALLVFIRTEPTPPKHGHSLPIIIDESQDYAVDDIAHRDVGEQPFAGDILKGEDTKDISVFLRYKFQVVGDVDGYKDSATKGRDEEEDPAHHPQETEKGDGVETELVEEDRLFGVYEGRYP